MFLIYNKESGIVVEKSLTVPRVVDESNGIVEVNITDEEINDLAEIIINSTDPVMFSAKRLTDVQRLQKLVKQQLEMIELLIQMNLEREGIV